MSHLSGQVKSVILVKSLFPGHIVQSLFIDNCGLINIQLCPFYVISDQAEDISRLFGVQLYLSGTIGAFHVPAIDDKKKKYFSLRSDVLFVV